MNGLRYALNNAWLESQGLVSFRKRWVTLASIRWTAVCGPACTVVWELGEKHPRLPDWQTV